MELLLKILSVFHFSWELFFTTIDIMDYEYPYIHLHLYTN